MSLRFNNNIFRDEFINRAINIKVVCFEIIHSLSLKRVLLFVLGTFIVFFLTFGSVYRLNHKIRGIYHSPIVNTTISNQKGRILSRDGLTLASFDTPKYELRLDCKLFNDSFRGGYREKEKSEVLHSWAIGLENILQNNTTDYYEHLIKKSVFSGHNQYQLIASNITESQKIDLQFLPYFNNTRKGVMFVKTEQILFPFGDLGRRCIGSNFKDEIGILGAYRDNVVGRYGVIVKKRVGVFAEKYKEISNEKPVDGINIQTTLSVEHMQLADKVLRKYIKNGIEGCVIMSDQKGAISSMINLTGYQTGTIREGFNNAIANLYNSGSFGEKFVSSIVNNIDNQDEAINCIRDLFCCDNCYDFEIKGFNKSVVDTLNTATNILLDKNVYLSTPIHLLAMCNAAFSNGELWAPHITKMNVDNLYKDHVISDAICNSFQAKAEKLGQHQIISGYNLAKTSGQIVSSTAYVRHANGDKCINILCTMFLTNPECPSSSNCVLKNNEAKRVVEEIINLL